MTYSRSVSFWSSGGRWSCSATRVPFSNESSPPCLSVSPARIRSSVVLPAPFGPESATRSRRSTENETPSKRTFPAISLRRLEAMTTAMTAPQGTPKAYPCFRPGVGGFAADASSLDRFEFVASVLALDIGSSSVRAQRFDEHAEPDGELRQEKYDTRD